MPGMGTSTPARTFEEWNRIDELIELAERPSVVDETICARCRDEIDDAGFCSTCGAVTIAGQLRVAAE